MLERFFSRIFELKNLVKVLVPQSKLAWRYCL